MKEHKLKPSEVVLEAEFATSGSITFSEHHCYNCALASFPGSLVRCPERHLDSEEKLLIKIPKQLLNKRMNTALGQGPSSPGITWCQLQHNWKAALQVTLGHYIARWQMTCVLLFTRDRKDGSKCTRLRTLSHSLLVLSPSLAKNTVHSWRKWECTYIIL